MPRLRRPDSGYGWGGFILGTSARSHSVLSVIAGTYGQRLDHHTFAARVALLNQRARLKDGLARGFQAGPDAREALQRNRKSFRSGRETR